VTTFTWILVSSLAMSAIAWVGLVSVLVNQDRLQKLLLPLVAFSAGSLLGGALLLKVHEALQRLEIAVVHVRFDECVIRPTVDVSQRRHVLESISGHL
jgi:hypothetical protein